ncbi:hypothetical protein C9374_008714 [Naegleria lovaniensis]|uniref:Peptidase M20 dimerisation domain-containing protein n=1 Tax=Naegleria lovaniensis TaxID=51637 RepID=A0AA88GIQ4_NAELO|nr:uncharacterized protein C9374_008714 [Naegleria lovaniensis]KAG2378092.1 hypothetical protein C9374_008714 [Naegleria lovaniensis]
MSSSSLQKSLEAIKGLNPAPVWNYFVRLSQCPRPSKKETKAIEFLKEYAKENNFEIKVDKVGNCLIKVPATPGYENAPTVAIQGHIDMVCEKNKTTQHDFDNDPITLLRTEDGEWIKANGTTLGSDNGIGVCTGLALATDKDAIHGPMELLLTIDEETGMTGVMALTPDFCTAKYLLNLDAEELGAFYVGCAGGMDTVATFDIVEEELTNPSEYEQVSIMVGGLKGGHSGIDIHTGRGNAIKLLGRTLKYVLDDVTPDNVKVYYIEAGSKRNAIPREAWVNAYVRKDKLEAVKQRVASFEKLAYGEYSVVEPGLKISVQPVETPTTSTKVITSELLNKLISVIFACPHGVIQMSPVIEGLVETSTNLAIITTRDGKIEFCTSQRSSVDSAKVYAATAVGSTFRLSGAEVKHGDGYVGWQPNMDSPLLKLCKDVYTQKYGSQPEIKAIHAGLECGLLLETYPNMHMISYGPTIIGAHSPDEKVRIADVSHTYELTKAILEAVAKQN